MATLLSTQLTLSKCRSFIAVHELLHIFRQSDLFFRNITLIRNDNFIDCFRSKTIHRIHEKCTHRLHSSGRLLIALNSLDSNSIQISLKSINLSRCSSRHSSLRQNGFNRRSRIRIDLTTFLLHLFRKVTTNLTSSTEYTAFIIEICCFIRSIFCKMLMKNFID